MSFLYEAALFLGSALLVVPVFRRLGFGAVLGFLAAGVMIGPWGLRLVADPQAILHFAEIGVVFLLFLIGLEVRPARLRLLRRSVFGLGTAQVALCGMAIAAIAMWISGDWRLALIIGFGLALSSTAFVLQLLAERHQINTSYGRAAFGVLLFQDMAVIPMIAALPILASGAGVLGDDAVVEIAKVMGILAAFVLAGRYLLRPVLRIVASTDTHELFTAAALLIVIGSALAMDVAGISMGLGAFLAGVLVADSEYRHQLEADVRPFKELLLGLFFMAVGMSADLGLLAHQPGFVLGIAGLLILVKTVLMYPLGRFYGLDRSAAISFALVLSQGGEFAFILFTAAGGPGLVPQRVADLLILSVTLSMAATPVLLWTWDRLAPARLVEKRAFDAVDETEPVVILAGFGRFGQIVGRLLASLEIPFAALDPDADQVDFVRRFGNEAYYGDPRRVDVLRAAHADKARLLVIAVDDPVASVRIAESAKHHFPHLKVLARARNRQHALELQQRGCDYVIREVLLSSLDLAREALVSLGFPEEDAERAITLFREHDEKTLNRQFALRGDEGALIQSAQEARRELAQILEADRRNRGKPRPD